MRHISFPISFLAIRYGYCTEVGGNVIEGGFMICDPSTLDCFPETGDSTAVDVTEAPIPGEDGDAPAETTDGEFVAEISLKDLEALRARYSTTDAITWEKYVPHHVMIVLIAYMLIIFVKALFQSQAA